MTNTPLPAVDDASSRHAIANRKSDTIFSHIRHPKLVSGSARGEGPEKAHGERSDKARGKGLTMARGEMLKLIQHDNKVADTRYTSS